MNEMTNGEWVMLRKTNRVRFHELAQANKERYPNVRSEDILRLRERLKQSDKVT